MDGEKQVSWVQEEEQVGSVQGGGHVESEQKGEGLTLGV